MFCFSFLSLFILRHKTQHKRYSSDLLFIRRSLDNNKNVSSNKKAQYNAKYLWIRQALFEKQLAKIIDYLVNNSRWVSSSVMKV